MQIKNSFMTTAYGNGKSTSMVGYGKQLSVTISGGKRSSGTSSSGKHSSSTISGGNNQTGVVGKTTEAASEKKPLREQMREIVRSNQQGNSAQKSGNAGNGLQTNSILSNTLSYADTLKQQRLKNSNTANQMKKLKYQFKNLSSKIVQSKTSTSARKVVSQAKREIMRLKKALKSEKYDQEEVEAAIAHAKVMERVAKKKARHLEEEEMVRAAGGPCADRIEEEKERLEQEDAENAQEEDWEEEEYSEEFGGGGSAFYDGMDTLNEQIISLYDSASNLLGNLEEAYANIDELTSEMMEEMNEEMLDMLEEMGLGDLAESAEVAKRDMDPADLKALKIKHRNKEMKEIVKADADYMKTVFERFEKMKGSGAVPGGGAVSGNAGNSGAMAGGSGNSGATWGSAGNGAGLAAVFGSPPVATPTINITL